VNTPAKLGGFVVALALVFAGALGAGQLVGADEPAADGAEHGSASHAVPSEDGSEAGEFPKGLMVSQDGYTLRPAATTSPVGRSLFSFTIVGPDGEAVREYTPTHEKALHLIVVRRDLAGFQHLHPVLGDDGTWTVPLVLAQPGAYRVFADFAPKARGDDALTLGVDVSVSGDYRPAAVQAPARTVQVDGYTVTLEGDLKPGTSSPVTFTVGRGGEPVIDLQPYLAAYGHLVALRAGDLAYLHVHPDGEPGDGKTRAGPAIRFFAEVPSAGTYRLFLDFQHQGVVRTAAFTAAA
jgi:hypothetical protein